MPELDDPDPDPELEVVVVVVVVVDAEIEADGCVGDWAVVARAVDVTSGELPASGRPD